MQMATSIETDNGEMIVKRVSVPMGLEELMEGLTKEVISKKPKDIYVFASQYFSNLLNLREKGSLKVAPGKKVQSITKQFAPKNHKIKSKSVDTVRQLPRQKSIRPDDSPSKKTLTAKKIILGSKDEKNDIKTAEKAKTFLDKRKARKNSKDSTSTSSSNKKEEEKKTPRSRERSLSKTSSSPRKPTPGNKGNKIIENTKIAPAVPTSKEAGQDVEKLKEEAKDSEDTNLCSGCSISSEGATDLISQKKDEELTLPKDVELINEDQEKSIDEVDSAKTNAAENKENIDLNKNKERKQPIKMKNTRTKSLSEEAPKNKIKRIKSVDPSRLKTTTEDTKRTKRSANKPASFDSSKLRNEITEVTELAKETQFKTDFNPYKLRQEIKQASENHNNTNNSSDFSKVAAVIKIQALWRAFTARKQNKIEKKNQKDIEKEQDEEDNRKMDEGKEVKQDLVDKAPDTPVPPYEESKDDNKIEDGKEKSEKLKMADAVLRIQTLWRGFRIRNQLKRGILFGTPVENEVKTKEALELRKMKRSEAVSKIQALWRGYKVRKNIKEVDSRISELQKPSECDELPSQRQLTDEDIFKAATKIQAGMRGYMVRRKQYATCKLKSITEETIDEKLQQLPEIPRDSPATTETTAGSETSKNTEEDNKETENSELNSSPTNKLSSLDTGAIIDETIFNGDVNKEPVDPDSNKIGYEEAPTRPVTSETEKESEAANEKQQEILSSQESTTSVDSATTVIFNDAKKTNSEETDEEINNKINKSDENDLILKEEINNKINKTALESELQNFNKQLQEMVARNSSSSLEEETKTENSLSSTEYNKSTNEELESDEEKLKTEAEEAQKKDVKENLLIHIPFGELSDIKEEDTEIKSSMNSVEDLEDEAKSEKKKETLEEKAPNEQIVSKIETPGEDSDVEVQSETKGEELEVRNEALDNGQTMLKEDSKNKEEAEENNKPKNKDQVPQNSLTTNLELDDQKLSKEEAVKIKSESLESDISSASKMPASLDSEKNEMDKESEVKQMHEPGDKELENEIKEDEVTKIKSEVLESQGTLAPNDEQKVTAAENLETGKEENTKREAEEEEINENENKHVESEKVTKIKGDMKSENVVQRLSDNKEDMQAKDAINANLEPDSDQNMTKEGPETKPELEAQKNEASKVEPGKEVEEINKSEKPTTEDVTKIKTEDVESETSVSSTLVPDNKQTVPTEKRKENLEAENAVTANSEPHSDQKMTKEDIKNEPDLEPEKNELRSQSQNFVPSNLASDNGQIMSTEERQDELENQVVPGKEGKHIDGPTNEDLEPTAKEESQNIVPSTLTANDNQNVPIEESKAVLEPEKATTEDVTKIKTEDLESKNFVANNLPALDNDQKVTISEDTGTEAAVVSTEERKEGHEPKEEVTNIKSEDLEEENCVENNFASNDDQKEPGKNETNMVVPSEEEATNIESKIEKIDKTNNKNNATADDDQKAIEEEVTKTNSKNLESENSAPRSVTPDGDEKVTVDDDKIESVEDLDRAKKQDLTKPVANNDQKVPTEESKEDLEANQKTTKEDVIRIESKDLESENHVADNVEKVTTVEDGKVKSAVENLDGDKKEDLGKLVLNNDQKVATEQSKEDVEANMKLDNDQKVTEEEIAKIESKDLESGNDVTANDDQKAIKEEVTKINSKDLESGNSVPRNLEKVTVDDNKTEDLDRAKKEDLSKPVVNNDQKVPTEESKEQDLEANLKLDNAEKVTKEEVTKIESENNVSDNVEKVTTVENGKVKSAGKDLDRDKKEDLGKLVLNNDQKVDKEEVTKSESKDLESGNNVPDNVEKVTTVEDKVKSAVEDHDRAEKEELGRLVLNGDQKEATEESKEDLDNDPKITKEEITTTESENNDQKVKKAIEGLDKTNIEDLNKVVQNNEAVDLEKTKKEDLDKLVVPKEENIKVESAVENLSKTNKEDSSKLEAEKVTKNNNTNLQSAETEHLNNPAKLTKPTKEDLEPEKLESQVKSAVDDLGESKKEETEEKRKESPQTTYSVDQNDGATTISLFHSGEFHDTITVPIGLSPPSSAESRQSSPPGLVNSGELHDHVLPLSVQLNEAPPAGAEIVTSHVSDGVPHRAQASNKDASTCETQSDDIPSSAAGMETEKRNNATIQKKSMEAEAATKIQAGFRGYQVRKQLKNKVSSPGDISNLRRSARRKNSGRITDSGRISQKSKTAASSEIEEKSAVKIQAGVRGFLVRRRQKKQQKQGKGSS